MARYENQTASFMMYRLWKFPSSLCIPRKFVREHREVADQVSMMLETDDESKSWEVKIKKIDGDYHMKDGWAEFIKDNHIDVTDFLTFRLLNQTTFNVVIYRSDGCPRARARAPTSQTSSAGNDERNERKRRERPPTPERKSWTHNPLYFELHLKKYQYSRINLPKAFRDAASLQEKRHVVLEFVPTHHCENVVVDHRPKYRVDLARGWSEFRKANKLVYGKTYSFEFNPIKNVIHVNEVR